MKTITMDWDTYQKEIGEGKENYEKGFDDGAKANKKRLQPLINFLVNAVNGAEPGDPIKLIHLLEEAGEL